VTLELRGGGDPWRHGARAATDVTGVGLIGHLIEMTRASQVDVTLALDRVPVLDGACATIAMGIFLAAAAERAPAPRRPTS
jgi:selenophosphate synthase